MFRQSVEIASDRTALFHITQDYKLRLAWDPFLTEATLLASASEPGIGVRTRCVARFGLGMETRYVSFNPPRACAVEMTCGPWFLRSFAGSWRFDEISAGRTRVTFTYSLVGRPTFLTGLLRVVFARHVGNRLSALKQAAEQGTAQPESLAKHLRSRRTDFT